MVDIHFLVVKMNFLFIQHFIRGFFLSHQFMRLAPGI